MSVVTLSDVNSTWIHGQICVTQAYAPVLLLRLHADDAEPTAPADPQLKTTPAATPVTPPPSPPLAAAHLKVYKIGCVICYSMQSQVHIKSDHPVFQSDRRVFRGLTLEV